MSLRKTFSPTHAKKSTTQNGPRNSANTNSLLEVAACPKMFGYKIRPAIIKQAVKTNAKVNVIHFITLD
jgi:hypothetical protein